MAVIRFIMITIGLALIASAAGAVAFAPKLEPALRQAIAAKLTAIVGAEVRIGALKPAWLEGGLALENVTIKNPPNFKGGDAVECARVLIQPEPLTVFSKSPTIACVSIEGMALSLRYQLGDGTNLNYFKQQAGAADKSIAELGETFIVREVRAKDTKVDVAPGSAPASAPQSFSLGAFGSGTAADLSTAKTVLTYVETVMKQATVMQGMVQPLVDLLKVESAAPGAPPAAPAPAVSAAPTAQ
jgi:hypothetical protein